MADERILATLWQTIEDRKVLFIVGGIGVAPVKAMLERLDRRHQPIVLYRASRHDDLVYANELRGTARELGGELMTLVGPTATLAVKLFDETRQLHGLSLEYRLLLEVAALLHDIGHFINMTGHHKHTQYLLNVTPIIGLNAAQMSIVANVARYHRKSFPKPQHEYYRLLSSKDRVVVSKLASLLRLADAMDNEHSSRVTDFEVEYKKPKMILRLKGEGDALLEKWSLARKSDLFASVFSTKVVVEE